MSDRNTHEETFENIRDEESLAGLIRQAGARERPDPAAVQKARNAVAAEWRAVISARQRQRARVLRWSAAAGVAVAGLAVWMAAPLVMRPGAATVATLARVSGPVQMDVNGWSPVQAGAAVPAGGELRSADGGRAALRIGAVLVRMDQQSAVEVLAADRIVLKRGAVYIDAGSDGSDSPLVVETPYGEVRHLGTQYETRLTADGLRVRVREGRVQLNGADGAVQGTIGEQLVLLAAGGVRRERVARAGGEWAWIESVSPDYDINDRPLIEFLNWVARETGREVRFDSPGSERLARDLVMRGSVKGMAPSQALAAVLITTELQSSESGEVLRIGLKTGD